MIAKELEMPLLIKQLQALENRLPKNHVTREEVEIELRNRLSGYYGERQLDYYLGFLPKKDFYIFHNFRLSTETHGYFQMDFLLVSLNFFLIVEVKNYSGEIFCDTTYNQLIHTYKNQKKRYKDPLTQVIRQRFHLTHFFEHHGLPPIPIEYLVVFTNDSCILSTDNKDHPFARKFLHAENLTTKIKKVQEKYKTPIFDLEKISNLTEIFLKEHTPKHVDVLKKFNVSPDELIPGVFCPECGHCPMEYVRGKWICHICHYVSKDAHISALYDFNILVKHTIANSEERSWLQANSVNAAKNILKNLSLPMLGEKRWRSYSLENLRN